MFKWSKLVIEIEYVQVNTQIGHWNCKHGQKKSLILLLEAITWHVNCTCHIVRWSHINASLLELNFHLKFRSSRDNFLVNVI